MMAMGLLKRANKKKFGRLMVNIRDQYAFGMDVYPKTLDAAYELIENHSSSDTKVTDDTTTHQQQTGKGNQGGRGSNNRRRSDRDKVVAGMQYAQEEDMVRGSDGRLKNMITCFTCEKKGHYSDFCPTTNPEGIGQRVYKSADQHHISATEVMENKKK